MRNKLIFLDVDSLNKFAFLDVDSLMYHSVEL